MRQKFIGFAIGNNCEFTGNEATIFAHSVACLDNTDEEKLRLVRIICPLNAMEENEDRFKRLLHHRVTFEDKLHGLICHRVCN